MTSDSAKSKIEKKCTLVLLNFNKTYLVYAQVRQIQNTNIMVTQRFYFSGNQHLGLFCYQMLSNSILLLDFIYM